MTVEDYFKKFADLNLDQLSQLMGDVEFGIGAKLIANPEDFITTEFYDDAKLLKALDQLFELSTELPRGTKVETVKSEPIKSVFKSYYDKLKYFQEFEV